MSPGVYCFEKSSSNQNKVLSFREDRKREHHQDNSTEKVESQSAETLKTPEHRMNPLRLEERKYPILSDNKGPMELFLL